MTTKTLEIDHSVVRSIFPLLPSIPSKEFNKLSEDVMASAGLQPFFERTISLTGTKRKVIVPVLLKLSLGKAPSFYDQDRNKSKSRYIERIS
jgi:hypothetical protein